MDRRNFIGSLFGVIGTLPFFYETEKITIPDWIKSAKELLNIYVTGQCKLVIKINNKWIKCPKVVKVERIERSIKIICQEMLMHDNISIDEVGILTMNNELVKVTKLCPSWYANKGDALHLTYSINYDFR